MPHVPLNQPERRLQQRFMKQRYFNSLLVGALVLTAYIPIRGLPDLNLLSARSVALAYRPAALPPARSPLRLAGAWALSAADSRMGGLSGLRIDGGRFIAVSDLGAVVRFDPPSSAHPKVWVSDLREGPGRPGWKTSRDAEALTADPGGRGWWVAYEQRHSLWLYDEGFGHARAHVALRRTDWRRNRGIEGLVDDGNGLLALAENGRDAVNIDRRGVRHIDVAAGDEVADAARAPDGSIWVLLRSKGWGGISQSIAPLVRWKRGYRLGQAWPLPKAALDNFEGMAIASRPDGDGWRFWLVSDDGHRIMARTLLVALDLDLPRRSYDKGPATRTGPLSKQSMETP